MLILLNNLLENFFNDFENFSHFKQGIIVLNSIAGGMAIHSFIDEKVSCYITKKRIYCTRSEYYIGWILASFLLLSIPVAFVYSAWNIALILCTILPFSTIYLGYFCLLIGKYKIKNN